MKIVKNFDELLSELKIKPGDTISIIGSQHHRDYEIEIDFIPNNKKELQLIIETASIENLKKMGCCIWTTYKLEINDKKPLNKMYLKPNEVHYLFPGEWYGAIPSGFEIIDIFGEKSKFKPGRHDDDTRFGCLSYGFVRKEE